MKKPIGGLLLAVPVLMLLGACSGGGGVTGAQTARVVMSETSCSVTPAALHDGTVKLEVRNDGMASAKLAISENDGNPVASVMVGGGDTASLSVHLDADDAYHVMCGDVTGPTIKPGV